MNTATESIKTKFNAKKAELSSKIAIEPSNAHVIYKNYGGTLFKGKEEGLFPGVVVKAGHRLTFRLSEEKNKLYLIFYYKQSMFNYRFA